MMSERGGRNVDYRWRCRDCKKMFTVRTGTIFEETRLPLRVWVLCPSFMGLSLSNRQIALELLPRPKVFIRRSFLDYLLYGIK